MAGVAPDDEETGERAELLSGEEMPAIDESTSTCEVSRECMTTLLLDVLASIPFWTFFFIWMPDWVAWTTLAVVVLSMIAWRVYRARTLSDTAGVNVPYTTGIVNMNGKELFLVATIHISPRAPRDVETVIENVSPDVVMIELDEERLDRMRPIENLPKKEPRKEDLQEVRCTYPDSGPASIFMQRAFWNAEAAGEKISGKVQVDFENEFGLQQWQSDLHGNLALVKRGGPEGEWAPFALKAHRAYQAGARALLIMDAKDDLLPSAPFGRAPVTSELRLAFMTCNCGFPPIPALMCTKKDGEQMYAALTKQGASDVAVRAEFVVRSDSYPRRTLRLRLCQGCALMLSGIGILYGIIQCFAVEIGGEFMAAERVARDKDLPCLCIDSDLNSFWRRLGMHLIPTPCNIMQSLWAWLAFPRIFFQVLYPPRNAVDVVGGMFLHGFSFSFRTWLAFILAGFAASFVTNHILQYMSNGAEYAVESSGAVKVKSDTERDMVTNLIAMAVEFYMLPRIYQAVAACRDEVMYQSIVAKSRRHSSRRMVVVVGAGHANGILQRARTRGL